MKESLAEALLVALNRTALAMERVAEAQEENNKIMREDIELIRDIDLDEVEVEFDGMDSYMILNTGLEQDLSEASFEESLILLKVHSSECINVVITVHPSAIVEAARVSANFSSLDNTKVSVKTDSNYKHDSWMVGFNGKTVSSKGA